MNNSKSFLASRTDLINVYFALGRALDIRDFELRRHVLRFAARHLYKHKKNFKNPNQSNKLVLKFERDVDTYDTMVIQVGLVTNKDDRTLVSVLDSQDLPMKLVDLLERVAVSHGKHKNKSFAATHVLLSHGTELFLPGRVENCQQYNQ